MGVTTILFDVDGTLIDTVDLHAEAWVEALAHFGVEAGFQDIRHQIGKGGDQILAGLLPPDLAPRSEEIEQFRADLFKREFLARARPFPHVRDLFQHIRARGQRAVLASSGKADEVAEYARIAGVDDLIETATSSDDAERSKPFPDIFQAAATRAGVTDAREAVVVGDTPFDAEAARTAGFVMVGVLCGGFSENALRASGAVAIYRDPAHLLDAYDASPLA